MQKKVVTNLRCVKVMPKMLLTLKVVSFNVIYWFLFVWNDYKGKERKTRPILVPLSVWLIIVKEGKGKKMREDKLVSFPFEMRGKRRKKRKQV